jgi:Tc toxin complex TcA C-terminal TcB-binding domain
VRTSVVALIPPIDGIHATLSTTGLSRVVIGGTTFQSTVVKRDPETVALSSPLNASGLFELDPQSDLLYPFEGMGVDTLWEFRLPKAANRFDYRTIADVLISIEYTALNSFTYRQQVLQSLTSTASGDRPFSFRQQFADQWYDLHNPDQTATPLTVRFTTVREDFPPNLDALRIEHVVLYFARASDAEPEIQVSGLYFTEQGSAGKVGGAASSVDGVISTRRGNATSWTAMIGKSPFGEWELSLPDTSQIRELFAQEQLEDLLLVVTFSGHTPDWAM